MSKVKYLTKRIFNMSFKNFFKTINDVHKKCGKPRIYLFFDCIICGLKYQAGYVDYQLFEMYKMNSKERKTIVTRGKNNDIMKKFNNLDYIKYFNDKALFNKTFDKYLNRDWILVNESNFDEFKEFLKDKKEVIIKPIDGTCGHGVEKKEVKDAKELYDYILANKTNLVEEVAHQCKTISDLHPNSINTIRVVTLNGKVVLTMLRIGNFGKVVDNFNNDGLVVPVDVETGIIKYPAIDKKHNVYYEHPYTHKKIVGVKVPNWDKVKELCEDACKVIPELGYIGWDVCDGEDLPFLIEGNEFPGHDLYQLPPHREGNIGLMPIFEKAMEEKNENSNRN